MARIRSNHSRTFGAATRIIAGLAIASLTLSGCVSYTNVPEPESAPAFKSANHFQAKKVTAAALAEIIERYPMRDANGQYSVNLPAGTTLESAQEIVSNLPEGVVIPFEGMDASIPTYHIGRIWIRVSDAKVDVLYPARSFDGTGFVGNATVWINGGVRTWNINRVQHWAPGTIAVPPLYVPIPKAELEMMDDSEMIDEPDVVEDMPEREPETEPVVEQETIEESVPEQVDAPSSGSEPYREVPVDD